MVKNPPVPPSISTSAVGPKGVGGWLAIFGVWLILGTIAWFGQIGGAWEAAEAGFEQFPDIKTVLMWENFGYALLSIYGFLSWAASS